MRKIFEKPDISHIRNNIYYVPEGTTAIAEKAFIYDEGGLCNNIIEIRLPYGLKEIGAYAFYDCLPEVKKIGIPSTVEKIGEAAFWGLDSLESVYLSINIITIGKHAFCNCSKLKILFFGGMEHIPAGWDKDWNPNCKIEYSGDWVLVAWPCPYCGKEGDIYAVRNKKTNKLCAYCDECDTLWETPEDVYHGKPKETYFIIKSQDVTKTAFKDFDFEWGGYATLEEVKKFGWGKYVQKTADTIENGNWRMAKNKK